MGEKIDWVNGTPEQAIRDYSRWRDAVELADTGDQSGLATLLRSDLDLGQEARNLIADLFGRYRLARPKGRPKMPAYRLSETEGKQRMREAKVRYYRRKNMTVKQAIEATLREEMRDDLRAKGNARADLISDDDLDALISIEQFDELERRVRRSKAAR